jgi:beta-lactam-binding protein with PASTA domain
VTIFVSNGQAPKPPKPPKTHVPGVVGFREHRATVTLQAAGFGVNVAHQQVTDPSQDGVVLGQDPAAGTNAPQGATVTITVGKFLPSPSPSPSGTKLAADRGGTGPDAGAPFEAWFAPGLLLGWTTLLAMARRRRR